MIDYSMFNSSTPQTTTPTAPEKKGNSYDYSKYIKNPRELGASSKGTIQALGTDIKALGSYVNVLLSGNSNAQKGGEPLGNKYFLDTGITCYDSKGATQLRHVFINNIPDGLYMGGYRGLVPGVLDDLSYIDPGSLFTSFSQGTECQAVTMNTRDIDNIKGKETKYVLNDDIKKYPEWWFTDGKNPVTKKQSSKKEGMTIEDASLVYYAIGIVGILFLYKSIKK